MVVASTAARTPERKLMGAERVVSISFESALVLGGTREGLLVRVLSRVLAAS